jgi:acylphosphatase
MGERIRVHAWITGQVQGVYYRGATREQAVALKLTGWVRNLSDGRVEAVFEGNPESVERMLAWCRTGPPAASVTGVEIATEPLEGLTDFEIRR